MAKHFLHKHQETKCNQGHFPIVKISKLREPELFMHLTNIFCTDKQVPSNIPDIWDTSVNKQAKSLCSLGVYVLV